MEINETAQSLLVMSAKELVQELNEDKTLASVRQKACAHLLDNDEEVQIQVVVTRHALDFIDDFVTEATRIHGT